MACPCDSGSTSGTNSGDGSSSSKSAPAGSAIAGAFWMPEPPSAAHEKNPSTSVSKPTTGTRSAAKVRCPAHEFRTWRIERVVAEFTWSMQRGFPTPAGGLRPVRQEFRPRGKEELRMAPRLHVKGLGNVRYQRPSITPCGPCNRYHGAPEGLQSQWLDTFFGEFD